MGLVNQSMRIVPGVGEEPASANAYFGFTAFGGILGWGVVAYLYNSGMSTDAAWTTPAAIAMGLWLVVLLLRLSVGYFSAEDGVQLSMPNMLWVAVLLVAYVVTAVGLTIGNSTLVWAPWYAAFAVGYLGTGAIVARGAVFLIAGVASLAGLVAGFVVAAFPFFIVLGVLHVVPLAVDAYLGGRQMTEDGVPEVERRGQETGGDDEAGGVITE